VAKRPPEKSVTAAGAIDTNSAKEATGTDKPILMLRLINQAINALWIPEGASDGAKDELIQSAIALLQGIKPTDEIEGMLAAQMVGTHGAAMECLRRAMIPSQTFAGCEQNLKHAAKLMTIYARQIDALNKHRGKGQQKVTVEHVHVEAGGQAMVGHFDTAAKQSTSGDQPNAPKAIAHAPQEPFEMKGRTQAPVKQRKK
jgi:hypothetical protein